jgi:hydrogenase-4 component E
MLLALIILYVVTLLYLSIVERFRHYASLVGLQGWLLLAVALWSLRSIDWPELVFIVAETLVFKAIIVPVLLYNIIRRTGIDRVASVATFNQLLLSLAALLCSIVVTYYLADTQIDRVFFGVALYALLSGMLLIVNHKRIFSHLVGFLVIENGVFLFSMAIGVEMPYLINIAILLDILMSVLMLGLFAGKIGRRLHDFNSDSLTSLKD